jgi:hypothetical protein
MAREPDNIVLRGIRATLDEHSKQLEALPRIEKQLADLPKLLRYSMGQNEETAFRQSQQESRIDELFRQLEKLLSDMEPT